MAQADSRAQAQRLREIRNGIEALVVTAIEVYDPKGEDYRLLEGIDNPDTIADYILGGLSLQLSSVHEELNNILDTMIAALDE